MKKLLTLLMLSSCILGIRAQSQNREQQETKAQQQQENLLQTLSKTGLYEKLKTQFAEQFPQVFDLLQSADTQELVQKLGNLVRSLYKNSKIPADESRALQDTSETNIIEKK